MTNTKGKITLLICLVLSLVMLFVLSSCDNTETPSSDSANTGETNTGSNVDSGTDNSSSDTETDTNTDNGTDSSTDTDDITPDVPHEHSYGEFITTKEPTCTEQGEKTKACSCGDAVSEPIVATGHTEEIIPAVEPTCTETGLTEGKKCSDCGEIIVKQTVIDANGHTEETLSIVEPTCVKTGLTEGKKCSSCGEILIAQVEVPVTNNHAYEDYMCTVCGKIMPVEGLVFAINDAGKYTLVSVGFCENTRIEIPSTYEGIAVTSIEEGAFLDCIALTSISVDENNTVYKSIDGNLYSKDGKTLVQYAVGKQDKSFVIPDSVTSIGGYAFSGCASLESVTIGDNITSIGDCAFNNCILLESATIGNRVKSIGSKAFYNCNRMTSLTIGDSVTSIGDRAFQYCTSLENMTIGLNVTLIGEYAFSDCTSLKSIVLPPSITWIKDNAFSGCYRLVEVYNNAYDVDIDVGSSSDGGLNYYVKVEHRLSKNSVIQTTEDGYVFAVVSNQEIYLIDYIGDEKELTLPEGYNGKDYSINQYAFFERSDITKVIIPNGVTSIDNYAFYGCTSLASVTIGDSVTTIDNSAFCNCDSLINIIIPDSVTSIGDSAFYDCDKLTSITIGNGVSSIGENAFNNCDSLISVIIGNGVKSIGDYAFNNCYKLVEVYNNSYLYIIKGSNNYGYIGYYAKVVHDSLDEVEPSILETVYDYIFMTWENKYYLVGYVGTNTKIKLPESYNGKDYSINQYAFYNRNDITSVTIPNGVTSIGDCAFYKCYKLVEVCNLSKLNITLGTKSNGYLGYYAKEVHILNENSMIETTEDGYVFKVVSDKEIYLIDYIGDEKELILPEGYNGESYSINQYAFYNRDDITSVTIPNSVTSIGDYAFRSCASLTSVTIGDSVTTIGDSAFSGCTSLTNLTIPNSVTSIGNEAFSGCDLLTRIKLPDSIASIGNFMFSYCTSLIRVVIPNNVTSIGQYAFRSCTSLKSIVIPDSVTSIGNSAFRDCTLLTSVTFGTNLISIGGSAFSSCTSLTSVIFGTNLTSIGSSAFSDCTSLTNVTFGSNLTSIGSSAFSGCTSLTKVVIPNKVTSIGKYAFAGCTSLKTVSFDDISGWYVTTTEGATSGTNVSVLYSSTNATYLKISYCSYYWYCK